MVQVKAVTDETVKKERALHLMKINRYHCGCGSRNSVFVIFCQKLKVFDKRLKIRISLIQNDGPDIFHQSRFICDLSLRGSSSDLDVIFFSLPLACE